MLCFTNPGEINVRCITTLGVNVKPESESPIGFFGTGLKYAIAGILRLRGRIEIYSGTKRYTFESILASIRGHEFGIIHMNGDRLGFTTDLGKHWEPWQIYRELRSNMLDENGKLFIDEDLEPVSGETTIKVWCDEIQSAHEHRGDFWLESVPLYSDHNVEIHAGPSDTVYYHGIKALHGHSSSKYEFSYSIVSQMKLTEDRTFANTYEMKRTLAIALLHCTNGEILNTVLSTTNAECQLDFDQYQEPSDEFKAIVLERIAKKKYVTTTAREVVKRYAADAVAKAEVEEVPELLRIAMLLSAPKDTPMEDVSYYTYVSAV